MYRHTPTLLLLLAAACGNPDAAAQAGDDGGAPPAEVCDNGADDDGDGAADCDDLSCELHPSCGGATELACRDGADDDGDTLVDCADPDCAADPACVLPTLERDCGDGADDDGDGATDCADPDCAGDEACCAGAGCVVEDCDNGTDDDGDGDVDCADDGCAFEPLCAPAEDCGNGTDDDGDGAADCEDPGCSGDPRCDEPPAEDCGNGTDDDGDGLADCADPACAAVPRCLPEVCGNGVDDDGDGAIDCADDACAAEPACAPTEDCGNGVDDDGDGFVDCADFACTGQPACVPVEACAGGADDDGDGRTDCADADCFADPACAQAVAPGDLVITELMANPATGAGDPAHEWLEVHNRTGAPIDLAGFGLSDLDGSPVRVHVIARSVVVPAGGFVVLAHSADATLGFDPAYLYGATSISLANAGDQLELTDRAGVAIDRVDWSVAGFPAVQSGVSLDTAARDAAANDAPAAWCASEGAAFNAAGERGTPGTGGSCGGPPAPRAPRAGELVIAELLYNPSGAEPSAEWIEVVSATDARLDLAGVSLTSGASSHVFAGPLVVEPRARLVLCRSAAVGPAGCTPYGGIALTNTGDDLTLTTAGGAVVDTVVYDTVAPWPLSVDGTAIELSESHLDATANNDPTRWCAATTPAGADLGTPGAPNACP